MKCAIPLGVVVLLAACGGSNQKEGELPVVESADAQAPPSDTPPSSDADAGAEPTPEAKREKACTGFELDLGQALLQSACEVPNAKPDDKPREVKGALDVKVVPSAASTTPGGKMDLTVVFTNKTARPMTLDFALDPTARFTVEVYDAKTNKRADLPPGAAPPPPKGAKRPDPSTPSTARVTLVAQGTGKLVVPWEAVRTKWAPDKYKGTPPEMGFPRVNAGPLGKGKYRLRVVTPLTGVFEGIDKEVSAPKVEVGVQ